MDTLLAKTLRKLFATSNFVRPKHVAVTDF